MSFFSSAARQVAPGGLVVFDNADRPEYAAGYEALQRAGFVRLDFWGLGPINPYEWCTSVFVRDIEALRGTCRVEHVVVARPLGTEAEIIADQQVAHAQGADQDLVDEGLRRLRG